MNCISRRDRYYNNTFLREQNGNGSRRKNLYSLIYIENNTLSCEHESYPLTEICHDAAYLQPCTLKGTNEVVDIGFDLIK